ncbi:enoyl-CoA hydratase [Thermodesulforhabdus norvegica]|uniref:Enoyl-CoA hydratase domain-containing protein 3, mitochondrial n=1 Tax=Thermodesulforhabdus norvegica TaxID=39841 RepID=A0A1I4TU78_9BACT|nr:enoyl-CoA hydratase [Thermodesulforhabdus norvegica]SFM80107.1 short chain enoyl-CoA hydratase [Thermodesulforhabdus norvegica]
MGEKDPVVLEKDGPIGYITLNRPEKRNALSLEVMKRIIAILEALKEDPSVRVLIIRGRGPAFCAGHDLTELTGGGDRVHRFREIFGICSEMMYGIHRIPQPVIAQVHGIATAAGCQLVAACDLAVAERGARFATPGVKIGLFCTTPMVPLVRVVGRRRAMEMLLTGRFISAEEALEWGLVNRVVAPENLEEETLKLAHEIAQYSRATIALGKKAFYDQIDLPEYSAYGYAREIISLNGTFDDAAEGISAFLEKRKPLWKDS